MTNLMSRSKRSWILRASGVTRGRGGDTIHGWHPNKSL